MCNKIRKSPATMTDYVLWNMEIYYIWFYFANRIDSKLPLNLFGCFKLLGELGVNRCIFIIFFLIFFMFTAQMNKLKINLRMTNNEKLWYFKIVSLLMDGWDCGDWVTFHHRYNTFLLLILFWKNCEQFFRMKITCK